MTLNKQLHNSATHKVGFDPNCPECVKDQGNKLFTGKEDQIGQVFGIKVAGKWGRGKFEGTRTACAQTLNGRIIRRAVTRYDFKNLKTGRLVVLKSKVKIAGRIIEAE